LRKNKLKNKLKNILILLIISVNTVFSQDINCFDVARKGTLSDIISLYAKDKSVINLVDDNGSSMLILACYRGNKDVANFLLENNVDVNFVSKSGTALMACVVKGQFEMVDALLLKGANVDLVDDNGVTALMLAVQFKNVAIVTLLLEYKANKLLLNKEGKSAFEYAVFSGNEEIIKLLK
jgi:ankyrin repeat protein